MDMPQGSLRVSGLHFEKHCSARLALPHASRSSLDDVGSRNVNSIKQSPNYNLYNLCLQGEKRKKERN